jgi:hypothetical protein
LIGQHPALPSIMSFALRFRLALPLCLALLFALAESARALQLGETREQLVARHGPPSDEDHGRNLATYFWDGWSAQLEFRGGVVNRITYKRDWYLRDEEIASLLGANGGPARWAELTEPGDKNRLWARDDGAAASCTAVRPLNMVFESGPTVGGVPTTPKAPAPAISVPPPSPAADPLEQLAAALESAPAPSIPSTGPAPPQPPPTATTIHEPKANSDSQPVVSASAPHGFALAPAAGALLLIVSGVALYFFKRRPLRVGARRAGAPGLTPSSPTSESVGNLSVDQLESLLSGIFRRDGYRVELSSAANADHGIDLTLRRGSETVVVQCTGSKSSLVNADDVRHFHGAVAVSGASRGILITTGEFTAEARSLAEGKGIEVLDGLALGRRLAAEAAPVGHEMTAVTTR